MKRRIISVILTVVLLAAMAVAPVSASAAKKVQILRVTVDGARVRMGPSTEYAVRTSVRKGGKVFYMGKMKKAFAYVCTSTGTVGYMYRGFLEAYGVCYSNQVYYSRQSSLSVYKRASTSSSRVARLKKHEHVIVYQVKGRWAYIKTLNGKGGYVKWSKLAKA